MGQALENHVMIEIILTISRWNGLSLDHVYLLRSICNIPEQLPFDPWYSDKSSGGAPGDDGSIAGDLLQVGEPRLVHRNPAAAIHVADSQQEAQSQQQQ
jgi:hypothetical protein